MYRFVNPAMLFWNLAGTAPLAGGTWTFYEPGSLSILKDTYSDEDGTDPNPNPVPLSAFGRLENDVWMDGDYAAVLKDANGAIQLTVDPVTSGYPSGLAIPALEAGYLTNDGSNLLWNDISNLLLPDPTGSSNQVAVTNGAGGYTLQNMPEAPEPPEPDIVVTLDSFQAGIASDPTKFLLQMGSGSATANGTVSCTASVTFDTAYTQTPKVFISNTGGITSVGYLLDYSVSRTTTGFNVTFNGDHGIANGSGNINSNVPFDWLAVGTVEVP